MIVIGGSPLFLSQARRSSLDRWRESFSSLVSRNKIRPTKPNYENGAKRVLLSRSREQWGLFRGFVQLTKVRAMCALSTRRSSRILIAFIGNEFLTIIIYDHYRAQWALMRFPREANILQII
jgi:hypothetical protein